MPPTGYGGRYDREDPSGPGAHAAGERPEGMPPAEGPMAPKDGVHGEQDEAAGDKPERMPMHEDDAHGEEHGEKPEGMPQAEGPMPPKERAHGKIDDDAAGETGEKPDRMPMHGDMGGYGGYADLGLYGEYGMEMPMHELPGPPADMKKEREGRRQRGARMQNIC